MKVYALTGEEVFSRSYSAGEIPIVWDGRDKNGNKLPDGMYVLKIECSGGSQKKLIGIVR